MKCYSPEIIITLVPLKSCLWNLSFGQSTVQIGFFFFYQHKKGETFSKPSSFGTGLCWQWKQQRFLWIFQNKSLKLLIFLLDNRIVSHFRVPSCDIVSVQLTSFVCVTSTNQFDHRVHLKENFVLWVDGHWCWFEWWWLDEWSNQHPLWNCQ